MEHPKSVLDASLDNPVRKYPAIWYEDTSHVVIDGFRRRQAGSGEEQAVIALNSVHVIVVLNLQAIEGMTTFPRQNAVTKAELFGNNDVTKVARAFVPPPSSLYFVHEYIAIDDIPGLTLFILYFVYNLLEF